MKKIEYSHIKEKIEKENYTLLSKEYTGYYQKLDIICEKGHFYKTSWNVFRVGSRCPICYRKNQSKSMLKDFNEIKDFIEKENFSLISTKNDYKGNYSKLKAICPNEHEIFITWGDFKKGCRCPVCSGVKKKEIKYIKRYVKKYGYECLSDEYKNLTSKLKFKCPHGHIYYTTWGIFFQGSRCPECNRIRLSIEQSGPNCNFWRGGISNDPYCYEWTVELKEIIKQRDGNKCLNPECCSGENISIHHVDYNKKNCILKNLITVCRSCNSKANKDRSWHRKWYQAILYRRYNYKYED